MHKFLIGFLMISVTVAISAEKFSPMEENKPLISINPSGVAINGYDTVAYFDQNKAVKGSQAYSCEYNNAVWYFSTAENKEKFLANPGKFAPQYGGYCAHALAQNELVAANPKAFVVKDDKLYLYSKKKFARKAKFNIDQEKPLRERNWLSFNKTF